MHYLCIFLTISNLEVKYKIRVEGFFTSLSGLDIRFDPCCCWRKEIVMHSFLRPLSRTFRKVSQSSSRQVVRVHVTPHQLVANYFIHIACARIDFLNPVRLNIASFAIGVSVWRPIKLDIGWPYFLVFVHQHLVTESDEIT